MLEAAIKERVAKERQEGRVEEKRAVTRKALVKGTSPAQVAALIELPQEELQKLAHRVIVR